MRGEYKGYNGKMVLLYETGVETVILLLFVTYGVCQTLLLKLMFILAKASKGVRTDSSSLR